MSHRRLITALQELLLSAEDVVRDLDPELYRQPPEPLATGSVGAHLRHCLDTCRALIEGVPDGTVDYCRRERELAIEESPARALAVCAEVRGALAELAAVEGQRALDVLPEPAAGGPRAAALASNLTREIEYLRSHTLHHFAMVAVFLRQLGVDPGREFGVAPSTLAFWGDAERCAPLRG